MSFARKVGKWEEARQAVGPRSIVRFKAAQRVALRKEGHEVRKQMIKNIESGHAGGKRLRSLEPATLETRQFRGITGSTPLVASRKFLKALKVITGGDAVFIGVPLSATDERGKKIASIIAIQEQGATIVTPVTPKVIAVLRAMKLQSRGRKTGGLGGGAKVMIIRIKPRPVFKPSRDLYMSEINKAKLRVALTISKVLNKRYGYPT